MLIFVKAILPKLIDFDWRVDIQMNSNMNMSGGGEDSARSGQQSCILQLKVSFFKLF